MGAFLDLLKRQPRVLWLDCHAYCAKLLAGGAAPWLDVAAFVAWQRKAQSLLKPDVTALPLVPAMEAWLAAHPALREAMSAKPRSVYPLKILLADEPLRLHLVELTQGLRAGVPGLPLALVLPSPRAWVATAYLWAHGTGAAAGVIEKTSRPPALAPGAAEVGDEEADSASVYVADFLRAFGEAGVDTLLLEEAEGYAPVSAEHLACYQSVLNIAAHYRWDVGSRLQHAGALPVGCAFAVAPKALDGTPTGVVLADSFWEGGAAPAGAAFHYLRIPAGAQPEAVLQRLATLR